MGVGGSFHRVIFEVAKGSPSEVHNVVLGSAVGDVSVGGCRGDGFMG